MSDRNKETNSPPEQLTESRTAWSWMPSSVAGFFVTAGGLAQFTGRFFTNLFKPPFEWQETLNQLYQLGVRSLSLVGLSGFIIGLVLTLQARPTMVEFGAEFYIPAMVSFSIIREIGPVLTAMICAGKVGSGIGAELSSMKVTEQLDAMAVSGVNAFNYTVVTRVLATTLMVPILVFYADGIGLIGAWVGMNLEGDMTMRLFMQKVVAATDFPDIFSSLFKSVLFGFAIGIVGCYKGYNAQGGTAGVGLAANSAVVAASFLIFIMDLVAVQITHLIFY